MNTIYCGKVKGAAAFGTKAKWQQWWYLALDYYSKNTKRAREEGWAPPQREALGGGAAPLLVVEDGILSTSSPVQPNP